MLGFGEGRFMSKTISGASQASYLLSKSKFIAGIQCPKRLYLEVFLPNEENDGKAEENLQILNGYDVGDIACALYPGEMVKLDSGMALAIRKTKQLMADSKIECIHEATFSYQNILVRVDIMQRQGDSWVLSEVKASTEVKDHYYYDVAVQAWVLQGCGVKLASKYLLHVNNKFVYQGNGDYQGLILNVDISDEVDAFMDDIDGMSKEFNEVLKGDMPEVVMGSQCNKPLACKFQDYCQTESIPEFPLTVLPRSTEKKRQELANLGYQDIRDIPDGVLTNTNHQRVWRVSCSGKEEVDVAALIELNHLPWPRYYIDFETISLAVPRWKGVRPYMQIPFQWSCHVHHKDGRMEHVEFLDVSGEDPREPCAKALVELAGEEGVLIAYNAGFEKMVIRGLAEAFPQYHNELLEMNERFFDLLPITRNAYYHPSQKGSWSIKAVLPALVPELSYKDLDGVQNGGDAQLAWMKAVRSDAEVSKMIADQLLAYCELDTMAMVKIMDALLERVKHEKV